MRARHAWNKFAKKETTIRADTCQKVIDVAHEFQFPDLYIIVKVISEPSISIL